MGAGYVNLREKGKDNQALVKVVKRWVGEGGKATLVGAPDADILLEAIESPEKEQQQEQQRFWSR